MKITTKTKGFILSIIFILLCNGAGFSGNEIGFDFVYGFSEAEIKVTNQKSSEIENVTEWVKGSPSVLLSESVLKIYKSNSRIAGNQKEKLNCYTGGNLWSESGKVFRTSGCFMIPQKTYTELQIVKYIQKTDGKKKIISLLNKKLKIK